MNCTKRRYSGRSSLRTLSAPTTYCISWYSLVSPSCYESPLRHLIGFRGAPLRAGRMPMASVASPGHGDIVSC